jgi:hypothetical protein
MDYVIDIVLIDQNTVKVETKVSYDIDQSPRP